jgi:hypothetical protein
MILPLAIRTAYIGQGAGRVYGYLAGILVHHLDHEVSRRGGAFRSAMGGYVDLNMLQATGSIMLADHQSDVSILRMIL